MLNASGAGDTQEELEVYVQLQGYNLIAIVNTWWISSHNRMQRMQWMDGGSLERKSQEGKEGELPFM